VRIHCQYTWLDALFLLGSQLVPSNWPLSTTDGRCVTTQAVVFGLGSLFNHSSQQNVGWDRDIQLSMVTYKALRPIKVGEELCIYPLLHGVPSQLITRQVYLMARG